MRHRLFKLFFVLLVSVCVNCSADCDCAQSEIRFVDCPKTYVTPEQIQFYENGIFVRMNDVVIQTESLSTDEEGIFFSNARDDGCGPYQWKCERRDSNGMICNTCNWDWNYTCSYCRKDKK
jgi:hypothetical protein